MTKKSADTNVFSDLHMRLADEFLRRLSLGKCEHCGRLPATIQELEAIRKFLSDNAITGGLTATPVSNDVMDGLPIFDEDPDANISRPAGST